MIIRSEIKLEFPWFIGTDRILGEMFKLLEGFKPKVIVEHIFN